MGFTFILCAISLILMPIPGEALERPGVEFKIFQFSHDKIPRIDGDTSDFDMVTDDYIIGSNQFTDNKVNGELKNSMDPCDLDVLVRVGWVKGLNRLNFLYEAYDNDWNMPHNFRMASDASALVAFRLMTLKPQLRKLITAQWDFIVLDMKERTIGFRDLSEGTITSWLWDFVDGTTSKDRHPVH